MLLQLYGEEEERKKKKKQKKTWQVKVNAFLKVDTP